MHAPELRHACNLKEIRLITNVRLYRHSGLLALIYSMILRQPLTIDDYITAYTQSVTKPDVFWKEQAQILDWIKNPTIIKETSFQPPVSIKWFEDGQLNVCVNCIDRHLAEKANDVALIWEGDEPGNTRKITYTILHEQVCRLANVLKGHDVKRGDTVVIYMPMILEATYAMLACARIGAVHSVVFGGFSASSLKDRILDCGARLIITADEGLRGGKTIALKQNLDEALLHCPHVTSVIVTCHTGNTIAWYERDIWLHEAMSNVAAVCEPEIMGAEDPLFILYTSGSTGKPKGVLHTTAGYLLYAALTHRLVFDYQPGEVYWCTADVGWITGHSYVVYGPLANGATSLIYEGIPNYPTHSRCWEIVDQHKVSIFYTAPTAIRALMREGDEPVKKTSRKSLRILGTVGEPINPEVWNWYANIVGDGHCTVVDTWWQTETGGHMITPLPGVIETKPGSATLPFFGIQPELLDNNGKVLEGAAAGNLCIADSWPGQARTIWGDHERFAMTYFSAYPGKYFSGDGARRDEDGYYWITGRVDDVLNISGHRLGTAEIESALVLHTHVAEAAVVGIPHDLKGEGIYAFVTLKSRITHSDDLLKELVQLVRREIGPIASPEAIQFAPSLPKTRSGKIMRRILRQIASGRHDQLGDISSLADPSVVDDLIASRKTV